MIDSHKGPKINFVDTRGMSLHVDSPEVIEAGIRRQDQLRNTGYQVVRAVTEPQKEQPKTPVSEDNGPQSPEVL
jgi:hypothetical protein